MKQSFPVEMIAFLFVFLFLYTGISKLIDFPIFREQLAMSPILEGISPWVTILLPSVEIIIAIILFIPKTRVIGLYATLVSMLFFTGYVIYILEFNEHLPCSCGGIFEFLSWKQHLIVNSLLIMFSLAAIILERKFYKQNKTVKSKAVYYL